MSEGQIPLWQMLAANAINHGARTGIIKAIDYLESLSEDDAREMTHGMDPSYAARVMNIWRVAKGLPTVDTSGR